MNNNRFLTLYELNLLIQNVIKDNFESDILLTAEISRIVYNASGFVSIELIEKKDDQIIAKNRALIWNDKKFIIDVFETIVGEKLSEGMKILAKVKVLYHPSYGLTLNILNIDPSYTIGEMQLKKNNILSKLKNEGLLELNKALELSIAPQNIALISSESAAGYEDFIRHLIYNEKGYAFNVKLFPSVMQGKDVESSIIRSLDAIAEYRNFEVVVIVRGGGSVGELDCFNSYNLAKKIAKFPIPVLVGIGHDRDKTILDFVAYEGFKNPTAVAHFLINRVEDFENDLKDRLYKIFSLSSEKVDKETKIVERISIRIKEKALESLSVSKSSINYIGNRIFPDFLRRIGQEKRKNDKILFNIFSKLNEKVRNEYSFLQGKEYRLKNEAFAKLQENKNLVTNFEKEIRLKDPREILKRGFSITTLNGKTIKNYEDVKEGSNILTHFLNFDLFSTVERKVKTDE
ncbi:exodeoxyribonuclease VII, large subunit [Thermodesulfobium narugense DSM 14796]|uniref:Exodeoxyribonuclease 7 large subunit n=1 Tax=Thermodesulfobium narugense DSM 14796 TaxID=747365 RepID=M1E4F9_9BACT|nr:exodeoxyribonuclease VII large subunit [Thermodesulfobium narugense]AEE14117.1 exodeoxyribonuclease VII, large subunit [Thermodesulfobium narugense DSM 14796]